MRYIIFTDGGHNKEEDKISASFVIVTKYQYIDMGASISKGGDIGVAEALAIGLAANNLLRIVDLKKDEDSVVIKSDSRNSIDLFNRIKQGKVKPANLDTRISMAWDKLVELGEKCDWELSKINSHHNCTNGNRLADRLVKYALKSKGISKG